MKNKIKKIIVKLNVINILSIFFYIFRIFKIKKNKIVCINFSGKGYGDSPKYIVEQLLKESEKYEIVWMVKDKKMNEFPDKVKTVKIYSLRYFYDMATAHIWINNSRNPLFVRKRKKQFYIQTWHSPLRLKKIEMDAYENLSDYYRKVMKKDSKNIDLIISGCDFSYNIYKNAFLYDGKILKSGTPRCDVFFNRDFCEKKKKEICKKYGLNENENIILYAPTFRKNGKLENVMPNFEKLIEKINKFYKATLLVRFHPSSNVKMMNKNNIVNVSKYPDMQDLICVADFLITDYSSCCFDMLIANKPCILYTADLEEYLKKERNMYFEFDELPFPKVKDEQELVEILTNFDTKEYFKNTEIFCKKINLYENGNASKVIVERINKVIENEKI